MTVLDGLTSAEAAIKARQFGPNKFAARKTEPRWRALQRMMIVKARVRRDGQLTEVPAEQLVPGDVVAIEAGDVVPADGRLLAAATLEVAESALTGESLPVAKGTEPVAGDETPLGDRTDMVYMNTNVTRGTGEFVVTATKLDVRQWIICVGAALPVVVATEIRKAVHRGYRQKGTG